MLACCKQGDAEVVGQVVQLLAGLADDSNAEVRKAAADGLRACCEQGGAEVVGRVLELLAGLAKDSSAEVREAAADGLPACWERGGAELAGRVVDMLAERAEDSESAICATVGRSSARKLWCFWPGPPGIRGQQFARQRPRASGG